MARPGSAWQGRARPGWAWRGVAGHGKVFQEALGRKSLTGQTSALNGREVDFRIDPEFAELMPPGTEVENQFLEMELVLNGRPDNPLIVWQEQSILVDGHRRWRIITAHDLDYDVVLKSFASRSDAVQWILAHQVSRRSVTDHERASYTARLHRMIAARQKYGEGEAAKVVAEMCGQSKRSVYRQVKYAEAYSRLMAAWQAYAERGVIAMPTAMAISKLDQEAQDELLTKFEGRDEILPHRVRWLVGHLGLRNKVPKRVKQLQRPLSPAETPGGEEDIAPMVNHEEQRKGRASKAHVVTEIDAAMVTLDGLEAQCRDVLGRKAVNSIELRNRVFGSIHTIRTNLAWVRERKVS